MNSKIDRKLKEWIKWIIEIREFSYRLMARQAMAKRYYEIISLNSKVQKPADFHNWALSNYGESIASRIRSQLDPQGITIRHLLRDIQKYPEIITREWYTSLYEPQQINEFTLSINFGDNDFTTIGGNGDFFNKSIAIEDEKQLLIIGNDIKKYVDKRIAHNITQVKDIKAITLKDIDEFIDEYEKIVIKYIQLLTGANNVSLTPTWQYDWEIIFKQPWLK